MKTLLLSLMTLFLSQTVNAQSITLAPVNPAVPSKGTLVFDSALNQLKYWNGTIWVVLTGAGGTTGWAANGNDIYNTNSANVGLGTGTPKAFFNVAAGKTVLFGADSTSIGYKLIWYAEKGALRAGSSGFGKWDYSNVGYSSTAFGEGTKADTYYSTAMGYQTTATGVAATALGNSTTSSGNTSTAMGYLSTATGNYSTAAGGNSIASGVSSVAMGNVAVAYGVAAISLGNFTLANGDASVALGYHTTATNNYSTAMGSYNVDAPNAVLMVGNGSTGNPSNALTVLNTGRIGIGTTAPIAPLHITSATTVNETNTRYFSYGTGGTVPVLANGGYSVSLLTEYDIVTKNSFVSAQTATTSDARIKTISGITNNERDLQTLRNIQITDYHYKDVVAWGKQPFKKVIAQQVEEIYPQAVRRQRSVIPDVYLLAEKVSYNEPAGELSIRLPKDYGLKVGDKVELVHQKQGKILAAIISVSGNDFTVGNWLFATDKIFVFGREVDDFRVVDYEALSMLGISAIQQLASEVDSLKKQLSEVSSLKKRLEALEVSLPSSPAVKQHSEY